MIAALQALEYSFIALLAFMLGLSGLIGLTVVARMVEPGGVRALLRRLAGKPAARRAG